MAFEQEMCENYMLLNPNEGSILDLFRLLHTQDIKENKFITGPCKGFEETKRQERWILVGSIVIQKILLSMTKHLAWVGSKQEMWLNLLNNNGSFGRLILNFLQGLIMVAGKVVIPDKNSSTFISTNGNFDKRQELDKNIKHGDSRYNVALSMMAAKLSYENAAFVESVVKDTWEMEFLGFYDFWNDYQKQRTTQAFMFCDKKVDPELIVVAFRGTEPFDSVAWQSDVDLSWYEIPKIGKVHGGFMKALGLQEDQGWPKEVGQVANGHETAYYTIREKLNKLFLQYPKAKFIMTGHSLGAALAILFPVVLWMHGEIELLDRLEGIYTFGQPRVGDEQLGKLMEEKFRLHNVKYYRIVYCNDIVPRLPFDNSEFLFKHFGTCVYYNGFYQGTIMTEEPNKNYFSVVWAIPMMLNAVWELIRSFTISLKEAPEYAEGWFLRVFRVFGLVVPGFPAHTPRDYVNCTRLASQFPPPQMKVVKSE